jgi:DNA-binding NtrC family response regulator
LRWLCRPHDRHFPEALALKNSGDLPFSRGRPKMPTVLFVDDELPLLTAMARVLRSEPFTVLTATSADEALALVASRPIDVVVSDERMPGVSGATLLAQIHDRNPDIVCIMLTGGASLAVASRIIEDGHLYRFLSKPVDNEELRRVLKQALRMHESFSHRSPARAAQR